VLAGIERSKLPHVLECEGPLPEPQPVLAGHGGASACTGRLPGAAAHRRAMSGKPSRKAMCCSN
jgi:hypothetical protein